MLLPQSTYLPERVPDFDPLWGVDKRPGWGEHIQTGFNHFFHPPSIALLKHHRLSRADHPREKKRTVETSEIRAGGGAKLIWYKMVRLTSVIVTQIASLQIPTPFSWWNLCAPFMQILAQT